MLSLRYLKECGWPCQPGDVELGGERGTDGERETEL